MDAAYRLFEAKKLSEVIASVGEETSIDVLFPKGELEQLSVAGHEQMGIMFRRMGPSRRMKMPRFEEKYFDGLDFLRLC
jgi:hypothetical protein